MTDEVYRFRLGNLDCWTVSDGEAEFRADKYFANAPPEALRARLDRYGITGSNIPTPLNCLLIRHRRQYVLIDTGMGERPDGNGRTGRLLANLEDIGVTPADISFVILSHAHGDHMGGALDARGKPTFPRARYFLSRAEWMSWTVKGCNDLIRERLFALSSVLTLVDNDICILPGIRTLAAPGHTPGQIALLIQTQQENLLYTGDIIAHPIHLEELLWYIAADVDPVKAIQSRQIMLDQAVQNKWGLFVYHFPFPGVYRLLKTSDGFTLMPAIE